MEAIWKFIKNSVIFKLKFNSRFKATFIGQTDAVLSGILTFCLKYRDCNERIRRAVAANSPENTLDFLPLGQATRALRTIIIPNSNNNIS